MTWESGLLVASRDKVHCEVIPGGLKAQREEETVNVEDPTKNTEI